MTTEKGVAMLIGAGDAIGAAVARRFAKGGYKVCIGRRDAKKSDELLQELKLAGCETARLSQASPGAKFDLVVSDELDHLDSDAVPGARAATDHTSSRTDPERGTIYAANFGIRERPRPSVGRLPIVLQAAVDSQELHSWSRPRIVEGAGVNFVEVDTPCSVGS